MHTTQFTTRKTIRTTIVSLIGAASLTLTACGGDAPDEKPAPEETIQASTTTAEESTTSSEAPVEEAEDDGDDELANQVVASLKAGDVVTHRDDAKFWGTGVVREELSESKKKVAETILVDFESVPSSEFTFEAEGDCLVARAKDPDFKDRLTYFAAPGVANGTFEIDDERAEETGREFENPPVMVELACVNNPNQIEPLSIEEYQAEKLAELDEGIHVKVGRKLRGDELEIIERAEG